MIFEIFRTKHKEWGFRLKADNGEIIAPSESYKNKADCLAAIELIKSTNNETPIKEIP